MFTLQNRKRIFDTGIAIYFKSIFILKRDEELHLHELWPHLMWSKVVLFVTEIEFHLFSIVLKDHDCDNVINQYRDMDLFQNKMLSRQTLAYQHRKLRMK